LSRHFVPHPFEEHAKTAGQGYPDRRFAYQWHMGLRDLDR